MKETVKRFMVVAGMLMAMLATAVPALAESEPVLTGTLQTVACPAVEGVPCPDVEYGYGLTDEASGTFYGILSDEDLSAFEGQRVNVFFDGTVAASDPPQVRATRVELADGPIVGPGPGGEVGVMFELAVEGEPPASTSFFGVASQQAVGLEDPDGDGVHTGVLTLPADFGEFPVPVMILQGDPAAPEGVIEDFGEVMLEDGDVFSASVSFADGPQPPAPPTDEGSYTGIIYRFGPEVSEQCGSTHSIIDEATGTEIFLKSDAVDLDAYVEQRVTVYGAVLAYPAVLGYELCPGLDVTRVEPAGPAPEGEVEVTFELAVEGEPPADATFFGTGVYDPRIADASDVPQLTDPDGDGLYSATVTTVAGEYEAAIVQGAGTETCDPEFGGTCPGEPTRTIKNFGAVAVEEDTTLSASVSFDGTEPVDPIEPAPVDPAPVDPGVDVDGNGSVDASDGEEAARVSGSARTAGDARVLPDTGGVALLLLVVVGALLTASGFLMRRTTR